MEKKLVYTSWGPTDPTRAGLALWYAMKAKQQGCDVVLFLFHDATLLARMSMVEQIMPVGPGPIKECIDYLIEEGVKIYVCKPCFAYRGMQESDLLATAELKGMNVFTELSLFYQPVGF